MLFTASCTKLFAKSFRTVLRLIWPCHSNLCRAELKRWRRRKVRLLTATAIVAIVIIVLRGRNKRRKRRATLPSVLAGKTYGAFHTPVQELADQDPRRLRSFLRMNGETFDDLFHLVGPLIAKQDTYFKDAIAPEEILAVTLRYLAQGGTYADKFCQFRIPVSTLVCIIPDTYREIYNALKGTYLKTISRLYCWHPSEKYPH